MIWYFQNIALIFINRYKLVLNKIKASKNCVWKIKLYEANKKGESGLLFKNKNELIIGVELKNGVEFSFKN